MSQISTAPSQSSGTSILYSNIDLMTFQTYVSFYVVTFMQIEILPVKHEAVHIVQ